MRRVCSIRPIDRTLSGASSLGQSRLGNNGNEGVLHISHIPMAGASASDSLMSYPGELLEVGVLLLYKDAVSVFYNPHQVTGPLIGGGLTPLQRCSRCILLPQSSRSLIGRWGVLPPQQRCSLCILQSPPGDWAD